MCTPTQESNAPPDICTLCKIYLLQFFFRQILHQANGNHAPVKAVGGTCHVPITPNDVLVDLRYINRLLGLDINNQT